MGEHTRADKHGCNSADLIPDIARLFIRQEWAKIDPQLPAMLEVLTEVGAAECWHKKSNFKSHLMEVYKILKLWGVDDAVCRCGLMHSAYSNSFVNLAIFQPDVERSRLAGLIGPEAEELTHLFCIVSRNLIRIDIFRHIDISDILYYYVILLSDILSLSDIFIFEREEGYM
eukprot:GHUV01038434.1.p1 GENE.GHUV01038434.1~~GHUV01038434.1.p1  ORF type:complete len:172 (+),score=9.40 GHUV01038434.1:169-684(+)